MTKSELIERISSHQPHLPLRDIEEATKIIFTGISKALEDNRRIEIRGFGSFTLRYRKPRDGRNPKTGSKVSLLGKYVPHFKPGKELRDRVNNAFLAGVPHVV